MAGRSTACPSPAAGLGQAEQAKRPLAVVVEDPEIVGLVQVVEDDGEMAARARPYRWRLAR
jgi:hypothetical protein